MKKGKHMPNKVTIKDIAKNTGVSVASVHRALHGMSGVGEELRRQILEEARRCHYQMDESAALLRRNSTNITVLLPKATGNERFYYRGLWQGINHGAEKLRKMRVTVSMIETEYGIDEMGEALEKLYDATGFGEQRMDGLVTICDDERTKNWITRFIRRGTKVALIDRGLPIKGLVCSAEVSVENMGNLAVELADLYHKDQEKGSLLLVNGSFGRSSYRTYSQAVYKRMTEKWKDRKMTVSEISGESEHEFRKKLRKMFEDDSPDIILAASARITYWVCDEVEQFFAEEKTYPVVIGTDVFPEQAYFFEKGILKATVYQSHLISGEHCLEYLFNSLIGLDNELEKKIIEPLCIVMKDNYRYFLSTEI